MSSNRGTGSRRGGPDEQEPAAEGDDASETSAKVGLDKSKSLPPTTLAKRRSASKGKDEAEKQRLKQETAAEKEERQFQVSSNLNIWKFSRTSSECKIFKQSPRTCSYC